MTIRSALVWCLERVGLVARAQLRVENALDMPAKEALGRGVVVLVGERRTPKWATFKCPCGCGTPLLLSLSPNRRPRWIVSQTWSGRPSIRPSIRRQDGCRSHFWIKGGNVDWCADTGK
jgi:hypothetical protein